MPRTGFLGMTVADSVLLLGGGLVAGVVNTLAGAGSLLTVPLLVLVGLPGTVANGTNRLGVFAQSAVASWRFRAEGVSGVRRSLPVLFPVVVGSFGGSAVISQLSDKTFERLFGIVMVGLLVLILRRPRVPGAAEPARRWSMPMTLLVFLGIGLYGGAFQAGVGIAIVIALSYAGYDLIHANSIKVVVNTALTAVTLPVFIWQDQVAWLPAIILALGFGVGGELGARLAVRGGERVIRPVLALAVVALAGRMVGLY
jgi:uncharacterized membrane protein YfcA